MRLFFTSGERSSVDCLDEYQAQNEHFALVMLTSVSVSHWSVDWSCLRDSTVISTTNNLSLRATPKIMILLFFKF